MLEREGFLEMLISVNKLAWRSILELRSAQIEQQFQLKSEVPVR